LYYIGFEKNGNIHRDSKEVNNSVTWTL